MRLSKAAHPPPALNKVTPPTLMDALVGAANASSREISASSFDEMPERQPNCSPTRILSAPSRHGKPRRATLTRAYPSRCSRRPTTVRRSHRMRNRARAPGSSNCAPITRRLAPAQGTARAFAGPRSRSSSGRRHPSVHLGCQRFKSAQPHLGHSVRELAARETAWNAFGAIRNGSRAQGVR